MQAIILEHFIPEYLDQLSDEQVEVFWALLDNKPDLFNLESELLLKAATSSDARIHERALAHAKSLGINNGFALLLLESDFPRAVEEGTDYFCQLDPKTSSFPKDLVALCDSPHEVPRKLGLELLEKFRETVYFCILTNGRSFFLAVWRSQGCGRALHSCTWWYCGEALECVWGGNRSGEEPRHH